MHQWFWLTVTFIFTAYGIKLRRFPANSAKHRRFQWTVFTVLVVNEVIWNVYRGVVDGLPLKSNLPLHLCDFSIFMVVFSCLFRKPIFFELAYYLGIPGALMALIFPNMEQTGWTMAVWMARFYITHGIIFGMGFYFTLGQNYLPTFKAVLRTAIVFYGYTIVLYYFDRLIGENYFFLATPPAHPSFLREWPPWKFFGSFSLLFFACFVALHMIIMRERSRRALKAADTSSDWG